MTIEDVVRVIFWTSMGFCALILIVFILSELAK